MKDKLQRIALVSAGLKQAGLESVIFCLAKGMKSRGLNVTVFSFAGGPIEADLKNADIDVRILSDSKGKYTHVYYHSFKMTIRMAYLLKFKRIQVINIHGLGPERIAILASRLAGTPFRTFVFHNNYPQIHPIHSDYDFDLIKRLRRNLSYVNHCIAISDKIKELAIRSTVVTNNNISVINNGIDVSRAKASVHREQVRASLGFKNQDILLIQVGRFAPVKNQDISVRAMSLIRDKFPNLHLLLAGDGSEFKVVKDLTKSLSLLDRVHFLGFRRDVKDLLGASDIFLLPSSYEGHPISLLEAFANGLPSICTNVPGIKDTISLSPASAKLVAPRDEKALAAAIVEALEDQDWIAKAKNAGYQLVRTKFSDDQMVERYISLHEKLLSSSKSLGLKVK